MTNWFPRYAASASDRPTYKVSIVRISDGAPLAHYESEAIAESRVEVWGGPERVRVEKKR